MYSRVKSVYKKYLSPLRPDLLTPAAAGLALCFFGGQFALLISAFEACRQVLSPEQKNEMSLLVNDVDTAMVASEEDDKKDDNNDGIADVSVLTKDELFNRKAALFGQSIDKNRMEEVTNALNTGFLASIATLKVEYCKTITLANSLVDSMRPALKKSLVPAINYFLPTTYQDWTPFVLTTTIKLCVMRYAFLAHRALSGFHSSVRGGLLFSRNVLEYLAHMKIITIDPANTIADEVVGYGLAATGFAFQLSYGFTALPFPLNIALFPLSIAEMYLATNIASTPN